VVVMTEILVPSLLDFGSIYVPAAVALTQGKLNIREHYQLVTPELTFLILGA
jgi:hypothetical protein